MENLSAYTLEYTSTGIIKRWDTGGQPVGYYINSSGYSKIPFSRLEQVIRESFDAWQDNNLCTLSFRYDGSTVKSLGIDGQNVIMFSSSVPDTFVTGPLPSAVAAITSSSYDPVSGKRLNSDIVFNEYFTFSADQPSDFNNNITTVRLKVE